VTARLANGGTALLANRGTARLANRVNSGDGRIARRARGVQGRAAGNNTACVKAVTDLREPALTSRMDDNHRHLDVLDAAQAVEDEINRLIDDRKRRLVHVYQLRSPPTRSA